MTTLSQGSALLKETSVTQLWPIIFGCKICFPGWCSCNLLRCDQKYLCYILYIQLFVLHFIHTVVWCTLFLCLVPLWGEKQSFLLSRTYFLETVSANTTMQTNICCQLHNWLFLVPLAIVFTGDSREDLGTCLIMCWGAYFFFFSLKIAYLSLFVLEDLSSSCLLTSQTLRNSCSPGLQPHGYLL